MPRFKSINDICNQVAVETGVPSQLNIFASTDPASGQLISLSNAIGYELLQDEAWQGFARKHSITTHQTDTGKYPLPSDFAYMLNQTGWDRMDSQPLRGPLSPQEWQYLEATGNAGELIFVSFRQAEHEFWLMPTPPPEGKEITFEYVSRNWVNSSGVPGNYADACTKPDDLVLYEPYLFERLLKVRFLESRGFDSTAAVSQYDKAFSAWTGKDTAAPILNAGNSSRGFRLLDWRKVPDRNYGT